MKLFKVSLNFIINISDLYKMKQYLTYILIGLAIAVVIGLGLYLKRKIDTLEDKLNAANAELFTVRNYISSEKRLANDDMFSANTQRNIAMEINNSSPAPPQQEQVLNRNEKETKQDNAEQLENNSPTSSYDKLRDEVANLRNDITNIEDLIEDSSRESGQSVNIDAQMYEQQLQNIETAGNTPIDDSLIEQVQQVNEVTQSASRGDDYVKNNNSEFEDLANVELEHNSEFDELLNRDDTVVVEEEEGSGSEDEIDTEQALATNEEGESVSEDELSQDIEIDSDLKNEIDVDVITNSYSKTELINLCIANDLSKSGNKTTLVNRLLEANVDLTKDDDELQTINSS